MPTERELDLVKSSYEQLLPHMEPTSLFFYDTLFRKAPHLRALFREDLKGQGMRFMTTLGTILDDMISQEGDHVDYAQLGHLHTTLGIKAGDFEPMQEALMDTLRDRLGEDFVPELEAAWRKAYKAFATKLIADGAIPA